ncbi:uncharacterized protein TEOVI_000545600 [Trypanosoma equiperdum]|uniref:Cilia- and flagella-associated protein 58 central coiled coil domain-containing protein n=1 Tax=Trypanosoma equiperdum TaxID=5694 RepID=A0A1G4I4W0_TRYEQ|nr:hypothetical protein, conserved [Trypanosoma equiperdum]
MSTENEGESKENPSYLTVELEHVGHVSIDAIEHHYMELQKELAMEPHLRPLREEYEKIHRLLRKSHDGEKRLMAKIKELDHDLITHAANVESALKLARQDEDVIEALRREIEKAWSLADSAHAREKETREQIQELRQQVVRLNGLVDKNTSSTLGQENFLRDLIKAKKEFENERLMAQAKAERLVDERLFAQRKMHKLREDSECVRHSLENTLKNYEGCLRNLSDTKRDRESLEQQVREYRVEADEHLKEIASVRQSVAELAKEEEKLKALALSERDSVGQLAKQLEEQQDRFKKEADKLAAVEAHNAEMKQEIPKMRMTLKGRHAEVERLALSLRKARKGAGVQQTEIDKQMQTRASLMEQTEKMHTAIEELLRTLDDHVKALHDEEVRLKGAMPIKTKLLTENSRVDSEKAMMEGQRMLEEGKRRNLTQQLEKLLRDNETMRKKIFELEQNQAKILDNGQREALQYHRVLEQTRKQQGQAKLLQQQLEDNEKRLKAQQDLLDRVSADRARTEKRLKESELECSGLKQRYNHNGEEIQLLKMQIIGKEGALCRIHMVRKQLQRDIANAEERASHLKEDGTSATNRYETLKGEVKQLSHLIAECDAEKSKYQSKFAALVNERNVLATQLVRRNEELRLLHSKIRLQECSIEKGAEDYNKRVRAVMGKRSELEELRLRCRVALARMLHAEKLRRRKQKIERDLFTEKRRSRALADELQRPVNVHRWRRLEGNAPEILDGIYKVHTLERQILKKQDLLVEKTKQLAARNAEYEAVRKKLAELQGPEVAGELSLYDENLQCRREQIRGLDTELQEVEQHVDVVAEEVKQLTVELCEVKRRYYNAKHKNDLLRREQGAFRAMWGGSSAVARTALAAIENASERRQLQQQGSISSRRQPLWRTRAQKRREQIKQEEQIVQVLSTGAPAPSFPLQVPPGQRIFLGGGFALTR